MKWTLAAIGMGGLVLGSAFPLVRAVEPEASLEPPEPPREVARDGEIGRVDSVEPRGETGLPEFTDAPAPGLEALQFGPGSLEGARPELALDARIFSRVGPRSWKRHEEVVP